MNGWLLVDKPGGVTSHDVVQSARGWLRQRRVGHTGTLDPLATGLMVLCLGYATRLSEYLLEQTKEYCAVIRFGQTTDSYDADGEVTSTNPVNIGLAEVTNALHQFRGEINQIPPVFSAKKHSGKRSYKLAREGKTVRMRARRVRIDKLHAIDFENVDVTLELSCSAGTYVRSLAHDLGQVLGCGAHLVSLRRTAVGKFSIQQAHTTKELESEFVSGLGKRHVLPPGEALSDWPEIMLRGEWVRKLQHGNPVKVGGSIPHRLGLAYDSRGKLIAVVEGHPKEGHWQPRKVLIQQ